MAQAAEEEQEEAELEEEVAEDEEDEEGFAAAPDDDEEYVGSDSDGDYQEDEEEEEEEEEEDEPEDDDDDDDDDYDDARDADYREGRSARGRRRSSSHAPHHGAGSDGDDHGGRRKRARVDVTATPPSRRASTRSEHDDASAQGSPSVAAARALDAISEGRDANGWLASSGQAAGAAGAGAVESEATQSLPMLDKQAQRLREERKALQAGGIALAVTEAEDAADPEAAAARKRQRDEALEATLRHTYLTELYGRLIRFMELNRERPLGQPYRSIPGLTWAYAYNLFSATMDRRNAWLVSGLHIDDIHELERDPSAWTFTAADVETLQTVLATLDQRVDDLNARRLAASTFAIPDLDANVQKIVRQAVRPQWRAVGSATARRFSRCSGEFEGSLRVQLVAVSRAVDAGGVGGGGTNAWARAPDAAGGSGSRSAERTQSTRGAPATASTYVPAWKCPLLSSRM